MKRKLSVVCLIVAIRSSGPPASGKIIKEMPGSVASGTPYIIYSECVYVAIVIQHTMRMRTIILSSVTCLILPYFSTLFYKYIIFGKIIGHKMCVLASSTTFC